MKKAGISPAFFYGVSEENFNSGNPGLHKGGKSFNAEGRRAAIQAAPQRAAVKTGKRVKAWLLLKRWFLPQRSPSNAEEIGKPGQGLAAIKAMCFTTESQKKRRKS